MLDIKHGAEDHRTMRTTIVLDDDILQSARALAKSRASVARPTPSGPVNR